VRRASRGLEGLGRGVAVGRDAVVHEQKVADRLAHCQGVCMLLVCRLDEVVDEPLFREPHRQLVRRRNGVDAGLEVERVHVVADEVELRM